MLRVGGTPQVREGWRGDTMEKYLEWRGREWRAKGLSPTLPTNNLI